MEKVVCPECRKSPEDVLNGDDITDWYWSRGLFTPDDQLYVHCPSCDAALIVNTYSVVIYDVELDEEESA